MKSVTDLIPFHKILCYWCFKGMSDLITPTASEGDTVLVPFGSNREGELPSRWVTLLVLSKYRQCLFHALVSTWVDCMEYYWNLFEESSFFLPVIFVCNQGTIRFYVVSRILPLWLVNHNLILIFLQVFTIPLRPSSFGAMRVTFPFTCFTGLSLSCLSKCCVDINSWWLLPDPELDPLSLNTPIPCLLAFIININTNQELLCLFFLQDY